MFDFRYHALSLVAVFIALAVGVLLGVAIGDAGLVSSAREDVVEDLRGDIRDANRRADGLRGRLNRRDDFERRVYPEIVSGRLTGRRFGLVFLGGSSDRIADLVREALDGTDAELRSVSVLREPPDRAALAARAGKTRYADLGSDEALLQPFAERVGQQLIEGGRLVERVRPALVSSFSGDLGLLDGTIVVRLGRRDRDADGAESISTLEEGLVRGMERADRPVVGVETSDTDPSQIGWYSDRNIASVDNLDDIAGRAALVFALAGADGAYGTKATAEALLPRLVGDGG